MIVVVILCWGLPLVAVLACVIIDEVTSAGSIGYGAANAICWIADESSRLFVFAIPSFVSAILNAVLLAISMTFMALLRRVNGNFRSNVQFTRLSEMAMVALRLFASVGGQWVLGFVLYLNRNPVVETLFTISVSLQGVFVFLSFLSTRIARQRIAMWARIVLRRGPARVAPSVACVDPQAPHGRGMPSSHESASGRRAGKSDDDADVGGTATQSTGSTSVPVLTGRAPWMVVGGHSAGFSLQSVTEVEERREGEGTA